MDESNTLQSLSDYGYDFLSKVIELLIAHPDFYLISKGSLKREYFADSEPHKCLLDIIDKYFDKYNIVPSVVELKTINKSNPNPVLKDKCDYILDVITINIDSGFDIKHYDFYIDELKKYIKRKVYELTFRECLPLLSEGKFDDIDIKFHNAIQDIDFDIQIKNAIELFQEIDTENRKAIPTGWKLIDDILRGGLAAGELACIMGEITAGKSWMLQQIAVGALKSGHNVLHISLENRKRDVILRYASLINKKYVDEVLPNKEDMLKQLDNFFIETKSNLWVEEFPTGGLSITEIYGLVRRYENKTKKKVQLLILDYIDILDLSAYKGEEWKQFKAASEEIRKMEFKLDLSCWTATHFNLEGIKADIKSLHQVAGGNNRFKVVDIVFSFNRKPESENADKPNLQLLKNRNGVTGKIFNMNFSIENVDIDVVGTTTIEEIKKQNQSKPKSLADVINRLKNEKQDVNDMAQLQEIFNGLQT